MNLKKGSALILVLCFLGQLSMASHVLTYSEMRTQLSNAATDRASKIQSIQNLLRHEAVQSRLEGLANLERIEEALPNLDDRTLDQLALESQRLNDELQAGELCAATIALIVLIAAAIVVAVVAYA